MPTEITGTLTAVTRDALSTRGVLSVTKDDGTTVTLRTERTDNEGGRTVARAALAIVGSRVSIGLIYEPISSKGLTVPVVVSVEAQV